LLGYFWMSLAWTVQHCLLHESNSKIKMFDTSIF
jgi:hypothetical protein